MLSTGIPSREPVNLARNIKMYECGWLAATATLGVWMGTYKDGIGDHIDFSIMEALSGSTDRRSAQLLGYNYCGNSSPRLDPKNLRRFFIPTNVFPVKDDWVLPSIVPARWPAFAKALGRPELVKDLRFKDISDTSKAGVACFYDGRGQGCESLLLKLQDSFHFLKLLLSARKFLICKSC